MRHLKLFVFDNIPHSCKQIVVQTKLLREDIRIDRDEVIRTTSSPCNSSFSKDCHWSRPNVGIIKVNCDAKFLKHGTMLLAVKIYAGLSQQILEKLIGEIRTKNDGVNYLCPATTTSVTTTATSVDTKPKPKNDTSEILVYARRRQGQINHKIYALHSLVPNITKVRATIFKFVLSLRTCLDKHFNLVLI